MWKKYDGTLGFELEVNIVDGNNNVVNYIEDEIASKKVLDVLNASRPYQKLIHKAWGKIVKPELDASQLELYNSVPKTCMSTLQDELAEAFHLVQKVVNGFGYFISPQVVPPQDFTPIHSGALDRYQFIHDSLMSVSLSHRKSTNITWTHINMLAWDDFRNHIAVTKFAREKILAKDWASIGGTTDRINHYIHVVSALETLDFVKHGYVPHQILNAEDVMSKQINWEGSAIFSYEMVRLKSLENEWFKLYLSELRTVDGPTSFEDVYAKTQWALDIVLRALDEQ